MVTTMSVGVPLSVRPFSILTRSPGTCKDLSFFSRRDTAFNPPSSNVIPVRSSVVATTKSAWPAYIQRSEEHTSELQSLMRNSYALFCLKKKNCETQHSPKRGHPASIDSDNMQ